MSSPEYRVVTDLMSVRGAIRARSVGGVDTRRFELERVDDDQVLLSVDLTDALSLVSLIVEQVGAAISLERDNYEDSGIDPVFDIYGRRS